MLECLNTKRLILEFNIDAVLSYIFCSQFGFINTFQHLSKVVLEFSDGSLILICQLKQLIGCRHDPFYIKQLFFFPTFPLGFSEL